MATGNLYVCIKPFAAGEVMTIPADDPEHWALYLPRPEKGAVGERGERGRSIFATPNMLEASGESILNKGDISGDPKQGDLLVSTNEASPGRLGIVTEDVGSFKARTCGDLCPAGGSGVGTAGELFSAYATGYGGSAPKGQVPYFSDDERIVAVEFISMGQLIFSTTFDSSLPAYKYIRLMKVQGGSSFTWKGYGIKESGEITFLEPNEGQTVYMKNSGYGYSQMMTYRKD